MVSALITARACSLRFSFCLVCTIFFCKNSCHFCHSQLFCFTYCFVVIWLSVPVQSIARNWKDKSPKWPVMRRVGRSTLYSLTHSVHGYTNKGTGLTSSLCNYSNRGAYVWLAETGHCERNLSTASVCKPLTAIDNKSSLFRMLHWN